MKLGARVLATAIADKGELAKLLSPSGRALSPANETKVKHFLFILADFFDLSRDLISPGEDFNYRLELGPSALVPKYVKVNTTAQPRLVPDRVTGDEPPPTVRSAPGSSALNDIPVSPSVKSHGPSDGPPEEDNVLRVEEVRGSSDNRITPNTSTVLGRNLPNRKAAAASVPKTSRLSANNSRRVAEYVDVSDDSDEGTAAPVIHIKKKAKMSNI